MNTRTQLNEDGSLDEFVASDVEMVHFEQMDDAAWWIGINLNDGTMIHIDCGAVNQRAKSYANIWIEEPAAVSGPVNTTP